MNLNKKALVDTVAEAAPDYSKKEISAVIDAFIETIEKTVALGDKVTLFGFGTFEAKKRAARVGRNPATGELIQIAARITPTFSASKAFKDIVNA